MASLSVALPLQLDSGDGFDMIKSFRKLARQNLKMLLLTDPGERVMEPDFGAGLKSFLFENYHRDIGAQIDSKIREQVDIFMPAIEIIDIIFDETDIDSNVLGIEITFLIPEIGVKDLLRFTI